MNLAGKLIVWLGILAAISAGVNTPLSSADDGQEVKWETIIGILVPNAIVGGFTGVPGPWTASEGKARVNLATGHIKFKVKGLVLAFQPVPPAVIGTTGIVTQVKGTLVCDATVLVPPPPASSFVDTPAVPLDSEGEAQFEGTVGIPAACLLTPNKLAFLIRVATPGLFITDRWNAHGAVRVP